MEWSTSVAQRDVLVILLTITTVVIIRRILRNGIQREGRLLPGPCPLPLLGSILSINTREPWLTFMEWQAKYGDIMRTRFFSTDAIILNSTAVATELLENRSHIYSDRYQFPTHTPYGVSSGFAFMRYGEQWRLCRRIFHHTARQLVVNMIDEPDEYPSHFLTFSAAVTMLAVYDDEPSPRNDPVVLILDDCIQTLVQGLEPEKAFLTMAVPFLLHLPDWLPGSWMKREAQKAYEMGNSLVEMLYRCVRERMGFKNHVSASMISDHMARMERFYASYQDKYETALKHTSATALTTAGETIRTVLVSFVLAMVKNPFVWKRAQAEIDAVVGNGKFPEYHDRQSLPYVDAIIREVLRWRPVIPISVRTVTQSDVYEGYYIPEGTPILTNIWAMSHDGVRYPDADKFMPERFLTAEGTLTGDDIGDFIFGFGRRRCPGRHVADASLWSAIVTMLAMLDFYPADGTDGKELAKYVWMVFFFFLFSIAIFGQPHPLPCRITPRSHVNKELLDCEVLME